MPTPRDSRLTLVPAPRSLDAGTGSFVLPRRPTVCASTEAFDTLADLLVPGTGLRLRPIDGPADLSVGDLTGRPEGAYQLTVRADGIEIGAAGHGGLVSAVATLRQLMPDWVHGPAPLPGRDIDVPCVTIDDAPALSWRGMHLDVARHFMPLPFLYRYVDLLAMHKLNRFHLHLTDDQGWRFEVRKYPRLTQVGCYRTHTRNHGWETHDGTPHGGYYTQDQLRALNAYAKARGIVIVPELDFPGHVRALLHAYPEFGDLPEIPATYASITNGNDRTNVATTWGVFEEVLHLDDAAVAMVEDIFTEVLDVFDSPWIHVGGDECPRTQWRASEKAARLASERGLDSVDDLQPWFTEQLRTWLAERGRTMIGWDEIMDTGHVPGAVAMAWHGQEALDRALELEQPVILAPWDPLYFDQYQSTLDTEPWALHFHNTWERVADYEPLAGLEPAQRELVLGIQGQVWTELMPHARQVEYMAFPRACILAELAWSGRAPGADAVRPVLERHLSRLDAAGVNARPLDGPLPWQQGGTGPYSRPAAHRE